MTKAARNKCIKLAEDLYQEGYDYWNSDYNTGRGETYEEINPTAKANLDLLLNILRNSK